eukprot:351140-Chlamydomonas_euryale.AAC.26
MLHLRMVKVQEMTMRGPQESYLLCLSPFISQPHRTALSCRFRWSAPLLGRAEGLLYRLANTTQWSGCTSQRRAPPRAAPMPLAVGPHRARVGRCDDRWRTAGDSVGGLHGQGVEVADSDMPGSAAGACGAAWQAVR